MQIELTKEEERILKARYKRMGNDLNADLMVWINSQISKEKAFMEEAGIDLDGVEALATKQESKRENARLEAERKKSEDTKKQDK